MTEDQETPITLSREDLYELVWSKPMLELAKLGSRHGAHRVFREAAVSRWTILSRPTQPPRQRASDFGQDTLVSLK